MFGWCVFESIVTLYRRGRLQNLPKSVIKMTGQLRSIALFMIGL